MPHLGVDDWEALLRSERPDLLRHLLRCPRCRRRLEAVLFDSEAVSTDDPSREDWPGLARLIDTLDFGVGHRRSPTSLYEAHGLFDELTSLPPEYRLEVLDSSSRFHMVGLAELLIGAADESAQDHPLHSHDLALLAVAVLEHLEATTRVRRHLAVAYCLLGDAERRRGRFDIADDNLANAVHHLANDPIVIDVRARLSLVLGQLRQDQHRTDEALALFDRSRRICEELAQDALQAQASLALGSLLLDENEPELAAPCLWEAYHLAADDPNPSTAFAALQALALSLAECDRGEDLEQALASLTGLAERLQGPLDPLRLAWVRARIDWRRGERPEALAALESVFLGLVQHPAPIEAARAGLELATRSLEAGAPPAGLSEIAARLSRFGAELLPASLAAVINFALLFPSRAPQGFYMDVLESVSTYLARAQFDPGLRYVPLAEPDLVVSWADVPVQQRSAAAAAAGVALSLHGEPATDADLLLISWAHEALTGVRIHLPDNSSIGGDDEEEGTWPS